MQLASVQIFNDDLCLGLFSFYLAMSKPCNEYMKPSARGGGGVGKQGGIYVI